EAPSKHGVVMPALHTMVAPPAPGGHAASAPPAGQPDASHSGGPVAAHPTPDDPNPELAPSQALTSATPVHVAATTTPPRPVSMLPAYLRCRADRESSAGRRAARPLQASPLRVERPRRRAAPEARLVERERLLVRVVRPAAAGPRLRPEAAHQGALVAAAPPR